MFGLLKTELCYQRDFYFPSLSVIFKNFIFRPFLTINKKTKCNKYSFVFKQNQLI